MIGALRCGAQPALFRSATATTTCAVKPVGLRNTSLLFASTVGQQQQAQLQRRTLYASPIARKVAKRFTAEHEWVAFDDAQNIGTIGITEYAQKSLGDVVYVELPSEGSEVKQGEQIGAVESVKAASDIYSPVTGQIQSVNDKLGDEPGLLNKSPEENGWLCKIRLTNPAEFEQLLDAEAYKKLSEDA